ncbi:hypothetical protein [uncultured Roseovarius sp.]|uniref:hypothetical protein n=1 Tax=uncultured Roseovarius sp. TaxID=293344 RepID=UPI00260543B1|nr:hypothetical protein [uncultured Roseovarius sp.]
MLLKQFIGGGGVVLALTAGMAVAEGGPNGLQKFMLYRSYVQDAPGCSVVVQDGTAAIGGANAASGAATCPDAFAWAQLTNAVTQEFWNWGIDQTVWPASPLPLCSASVTSNCCDPDAAIDPGTQPTQCPVFRADYDPISPLPAKPNGTPSGSVINHRGLVSADKIDPGRLLRDLELELVFRNKAMVDYIYRHDLYSREGLGARNRAQNAAIDDGDIAGAHGLTVRFPSDAVMVKADFLHQDILLDQKLIQPIEGSDVPNNPDYPYLTIYLEGDGSDDQVPGWYYMLAMTNASKNLPIWHWYAMEHVGNLGRCDYIGCNDSFGYAANPAAQAGANFGTAFIPPMIELNDDLTEGNAPLFVTARVYDPVATGEEMTPALADLFQQMGIAAAVTDPDPRVISADDPAWKNYRLKGTQSTFTTANGIPTGMGATITEGGFVNSASCTTCHSQAAADKNGTSTLAGVGADWRPNLMGYNQVSMGAPDPNWFYGIGGPTVMATQVDFVWGILNAVCQDPAGSHGVCTTYPDAPTEVTGN